MKTRTLLEQAMDAESIGQIEEARLLRAAHEVIEQARKAGLNVRAGVITALENYDAALDPQGPSQARKGEGMDVHICNFTTDTVTGIDRNGKTVTFDFSPRFGPLFLRKNGDPLKRQPGPRSAAWGVFNEWWEATRSLRSVMKAYNAALEGK